MQYFMPLSSRRAMKIVNPPFSKGELADLKAFPTHRGGNKDGTGL